MCCRCQGAAISSALCCLPPLPPGWLGGIDLRLHPSRLNTCQPLQCPRMTMASWQLFFNIFHCCSVSEMFFCGFTLGRLLDYIIVRYDYDYVYVSMAFPTAAFPRVQRKMVIVILHAGAPPKNAKIQKPNFAATISYSQCTWSILQCPVLGSNSCSTSVRRRDHLLQEDCGRNGNDLDQESQHTSSSRVVSGF